MLTMIRATFASFFVVAAALAEIGCSVDDELSCGEPCDPDASHSDATVDAGQSADGSADSALDASVNETATMDAGDSDATDGADTGSGDASADTGADADAAGCIPSDAGPCQTNSNCCSALVCTNASRCEPTCKSTGSCSGQNDCCALSRCSGSNCVACSPLGAACNQDPDCCTGSCDFSPDGGGKICGH